MDLLLSHSGGLRPPATIYHAFGVMISMMTRKVWFALSLTLILSQRERK